MPRLLKIALIGFVAVFILAALAYVRMGPVPPPEKVEILSSSAKRKFELPPGEPVPIKFAAPDMTGLRVRAFLTPDFKIVRRMKDVPFGIQKLYTMNARPLIAITDPGNDWQGTDVITDPYLPRRRLIFAGVAQDRAFIYYEEGGIGLREVVDLFRLEPPDGVTGLWRGYCDPRRTAANPMQIADDCTW